MPAPSMIESDIPALSIKQYRTIGDWGSMIHTTCHVQTVDFCRIMRPASHIFVKLKKCHARLVLPFVSVLPYFSHLPQRVFAALLTSQVSGTQTETGDGTAHPGASAVYLISAPGVALLHLPIGRRACAHGGDIRIIRTVHSSHATLARSVLSFAALQHDMTCSQPPPPLKDGAMSQP